MSYSGGWRPHIESALALDVWRLDKQFTLFDGARGTWQWTRGDEHIASVGFRVSRNEHGGSLTLNYSCSSSGRGQAEPVTCVIRLSSIPLHYGGRRLYMHCPYTGRRARKLFKFYGIPFFCHRTSIRPLPTYASQRTSGLERIQMRRWALRRKLGDDFSSLFDEPIRPRLMRHRTFERYAARDTELAEREDICLPRRLWRLLNSGV